MTNYHDLRDDYLSLRANVICLLLFLVGVAIIFQHPAWFDSRQAGSAVARPALKSAGARHAGTSAEAERDEEIACSRVFPAFPKYSVCEHMFSMLMLLTFTQSCRTNDADPPIPFRSRV
jgi:hypothetical protein